MKVNHLISAFLLLVTFCQNGQSQVVEDPFKAHSNEVHQIHLLNQGLAALEERLQMIDRAEKSIDVEYFIYNLDKSGKIFSQALIKKADQGVKVRMLLDYFMVKSEFSPFYAAEMAKHGIEVKYFNPTPTLSLVKGQYRNHRKTLLIDGKEAITGGRNIADEYFDLKEDFNFLDRDLKVSGPIVTSIQSTFNTVWNSEHSKVLTPDPKPDYQDDIYSDDRDNDDDFQFRMDLKDWNENVAKAQSFLNIENSELLNSVRTKGKAELLNEYTGVCNNIDFRSEYPIIGKKNRDVRVIKHDIATRFVEARESILFDSPYFIVEEESKIALELALNHKVEITLLTNSLNSTDAIYVSDVFNKIIPTWMQKGLNAFIYKGDLPNNYATISSDVAKARYGIHAKSFVFDHKDVVIGTFNFDPRSANYNAEMTLACNDNSELASRVERDIKNRINGGISLDSSKTLTDTKFNSVSFMKKMEYYLFKGPANLFKYLL